VFRGRYEHSMDAKGRTAVPVRYRDALSAGGDDKLVLTTSLDACVVAYPMREWLAFEEKLSRKSSFDRNVAMLRRIYLSGAVECEIDKHGRVLVPVTLRKHAGLDKDVLWAGMGRYAELWARDRFDGLCGDFMADEASRATLLDRLAELEL
jgi:MraZ protein